ncbi:MAG TPA: hypothetical protein VG890_04940, partial [Puia sp.]|nr:hypothetical protein [Puia sp.]
MHKLTLYPAVLVLLLAACHSTDKKTEAPDFLAANIDTAVSPSQDFFQYANGGWIKKNPIPPDESSWGVGYLVQEEIYNRLRKINEEAEQKTSAPGTADQQIGDFWHSGMDTVAIDSLKLKPLQADLDRINAIKTKDDLIQLAASFHTKGIRVLFADGVAQDDKQSDVMAYQLAQGGLGMPNRDYYFKTDDRTKGVRKAYQTFLFQVMHELNSDNASAARQAAAVYALELRLATASRKLQDLRDPYKNYNKMNIPKLVQVSGSFNWPLYLKTAGVPQPDSVIVGQPEFYKALGEAVQQTPINVWKSYLAFHLVRSSAPYLDSGNYAHYFAYLQTLTGANTIRPR